MEVRPVTKDQAHYSSCHSITEIPLTLEALNRG